MPNYCNYKMKLKGDPSDIREFINIMKGNEDSHMYRIFDADVVDESEIDKGFAHVDGRCAHSVYSCMMEGNYTYDDEEKEEKEEKEELKEQFSGTSLMKESKRLSLSIEIYSEEPGIGFEEHIYILNGNIVEYEAVDMFEVCFKDFSSAKELNEKLGLSILGLSISEEYFKKEGCLKIGGFGEFVFN